MALLTERDVAANVRTHGGERVLYLARGDRLTPSARDYLEHRRIPIVATESSGAPDEKPVYRTLFGAQLVEKPEHMTHLRENILVFKDHPRIVFRGMIDALEAELLLCQQTAGEDGYEVLCSELGQMLEFVRSLIPCDVLGKPVTQVTLCSLTPEELREHSHHPEKYCDQAHFMPSCADARVVLALNRVRTLVRQTELAAYRAFRDENGAPTREDIILWLNRLSSLCWIQMCRLKAGRYGNGTT